MKAVPIIDKYLVQEFLKPFFITLFILIIVLISSFLFQLTDYIIVKEIPVVTVLKLLLYKVPEYVVKAISMAVLFATLLSLTRLVEDNEFTALRMGGISFPRLVIPLLVLGLLISGVNYLFNEYIVPPANSKYQDIIKYSVNKQENPNTKSDLLFKDHKGRYFYIGNLNTETKKLKNILLYEKQADSKFITFQTGSFQEKIMTLKQGKLHYLDNNNYVTKEEEVAKKTYSFQQQISELYTEQKKPSEMSRRELKERIGIRQQSGLKTRKLQVEYHFKLAEPLACLMFVLLGAPLSIKSDRGRIFGFVVSVVIIFIYYVFLSLSQSLGKNGVLNPALAVWLPNIVFALLGVGLITEESVSS